MTYQSKTKFKLNITFSISHLFLLPLLTTTDGRIFKITLTSLIFCKAKNIAPALGGKAARGARAGAKHPRERDFA
jgi:hypothetical protein